MQFRAGLVKESFRHLDAESGRQGSLGWYEVGVTCVLLALKS